MKWRRRVPAVQNSVGSILVHNKQKEEILNKFFSSAFTVDNVSWIHFDNMQAPNILPNTVSFEPWEVHNALKSLPNKLTAGPNGLPASLLKSLAIGIAEPLSIIFTYSFDIEKVPDELRLANVITIFKNKLGSHHILSQILIDLFVSLRCVAGNVMKGGNDS